MFEGGSKILRLRGFLELQPGFMKYLQSALYWTRCKLPSTLFGFCLILPYFWFIFHLIVKLYESIITKNDSLLDEPTLCLFFWSAHSFFVTVSKMIGNKSNNSLEIGVEKTYRITWNSTKVLILWSWLLFLACIESYRIASKRKISHN